MTIMKLFEAELKKFCEANSLNYDKVLSSPRCGNDKVLFIQRIDKEKASSGTINNVPAEVLITGTVDDNGKIQFVKSEHADKYLQ